MLPPHHHPSTNWAIPSPSPSTSTSTSTSTPLKSPYMSSTSDPSSFGLPPGTPTSPPNHPWPTTTTTTSTPPISRPLNVYLSRYPPSAPQDFRPHLQTPRPDPRDFYPVYPTTAPGPGTTSTAERPQATPAYLVSVPQQRPAYESNLSFLRYDMSTQHVETHQNVGYYRRPEYPMPATTQVTQAQPTYTTPSYPTAESDLSGPERAAARRKMKRFRLTHQQTRFLMSEFAKQPHPEASHREDLARQIPGLTSRQVQVWFQNRRAKIKRLNTEDRDRMLRMRAVPDDFDNVSALHNPYGANSLPPLPLPSPIDPLSTSSSRTAVVHPGSSYQAYTEVESTGTGYDMPTYQGQPGTGAGTGEIVSPVTLEYGSAGTGVWAGTDGGDGTSRKSEESGRRGNGNGRRGGIGERDRERQREGWLGFEVEDIYGDSCC